MEYVITEAVKNGQPPVLGRKIKHIEFVNKS